MWKWLCGAVVLLVGGFSLTYLLADREMRNVLSNLPADRDVLFWSIPQRDALFRALDRIPLLSAVNVIPAGDNVFPLPQGQPLELTLDIDNYMAQQRTAGLLVVHKGKVRLEKYGLDFDASGRWTSFSVAKSFTSTLVGAAIKDGFIHSLEDKVSDYIPDMAGSVYDDVSIEQLLTMTSGVAWNEDYEDSNSDVARFDSHAVQPGVDATVSYMRELTRDAPAGQRWLYNTGETNLIGVLVSSATGKTLAQYLSEKIWAPFGMEQNATWSLGSTGHEISGCCMQAAVKDFARFGVFMLEGGLVSGQPILPEGWISAATSKQVNIGEPGAGYGYQWWTYDDGSFAAQGIFGQGIFVDPKRKLVIASNSNWPKAVDAKTVGAQRQAFYKAVQIAIDTEEAR